MDVSFDELYHREKSLIDNVAILERELRQAIQNEDPYDFALNVNIDLLQQEEDLYESDLEYLSMTHPDSDFQSNAHSFELVE